jgi:hypothetical protein
MPRSCIDAKHSENLEDKYLGVSMMKNQQHSDRFDEKTMAKIHHEPNHG